MLKMIHMINDTQSDTTQIECTPLIKTKKIQFIYLFVCFNFLCFGIHFGLTTILFISTFSFSYINTPKEYSQMRCFIFFL